VKIPFLDLQAVDRPMLEQMEDAVLRVVRSGWYVLGPEVAAFEREFADVCGSRHCVGVGNGLEALTLLLRAHGIGPGDDVIVPSNTYIATWLAVSAVGARPVPAEPDESTSNLSARGAAAVMTDRTRAVLAVHLYGATADMAGLRAVLPPGVLLLEDAAQAHGASSPGGGIAGSLGDGAGFSFYPTKNLGAAGDGGAVTVESADLADRLRLLRNYGSRVKYENEVQGSNSRLDEIQAAVLRVKLRHLADNNARRRALAGRYISALEQVPGLRLPAAPLLLSSWHVFVVHMEARDQVQAVQVALA